MSKSSFEEELERTGVLCYSTSGVSMLPLLHPNRDVVVVRKPAGRLRKYDVALYKTDDGRYILHRVVKVLRDGYVIRGDNCVRKEYGITDRHIIGVMDEFVRLGKKHTVRDKGYLLYSRLICRFCWLRIPFLRAKALMRRILHRLKAVYVILKGT